MARDIRHDGTAGSELIVENGVAYLRRFQAGRKAHLEFLNELRKNPGALDHLSFAGWELSIPEVDLKMWKELIPELDSLDRETRMRAWKWFMKSEHADPYRVRERQRVVIAS